MIWSAERAYGSVYGDNTIQYNTVKYNTIQYNTIQYNTIFGLQSEHMKVYLVLIQYCSRSEGHRTATDISKCISLGYVAMLLWSTLSCLRMFNDGTVSRPAHIVPALYAVRHTSYLHCTQSGTHRTCTLNSPAHIVPALYAVQHTSYLHCKQSSTHRTCTVRSPAHIVPAL